MNAPPTFSALGLARAGEPGPTARQDRPQQVQDHIDCARGSHIGALLIGKGADMANKRIYPEAIVSAGSADAPRFEQLLSDCE